MSQHTELNQYRKKPVVITAVQWFKDGDHPSVIRKAGPNRHADEGIPWCPTLEGGHVVTPGDWIITGVKGEHYPCKPDIFALTYEAADALQAMERVPMTDLEKQGAIEKWQHDVAVHSFYRGIDCAEAHHGITPPESKG